jgi:GTP-binding protein
LINRLLGVKNLARTSSRPGRTQSVNFYRVNDAWYFVDLPGYGWARVPEAVRRSWKPMVEGYLERRLRRVALALLVVDSRQGATDLDMTMKQWLETKGIAHVVAATKADKLTASDRGRTERELARALAESGMEADPLLVSVRTGKGISKLWHSIDAALLRWLETGERDAMRS